MKKERHNWRLIKSDYLSGMRLDQISRKHNVSINTLHTKIRRGKWAEEKKQLEAEALLRVRDVYANSLADEQVKSRDRYIKYCFDASRKIMERLDTCREPGLMLILIKALYQCQSAEFRALGISEKSNESLGHYVDQREIICNPPQPTHVIDIAIEALKNNNQGIVGFIKKFVEYGRIKGVDLLYLMDKQFNDESPDKENLDETH